ncbi:hypothetical protein KIH27_07845 [Mycobacterium sp. M1]|uniref:FAD/NAD(P)-binding domain-containing protein n=1 Tax=Mycolicibacter acidiphilus TaxID=2835306 RepID=A0ABS5RIS1_9MYCO|nr:hypothetical protein [Mycolicibacter acidiphilus]
MIAGGGPAGTGALIWAARHGLLGDWLDRGVVIVERSDALGGTLSNYALNADSRGSSFLECLDGPNCEPFLTEVRADPVTRELGRWRDRRPPLELVDRFQRRLGAALRAEFDRHPRSRVLTGVTVRAVHLKHDGALVAKVVERDSRPAAINSSSIVLALGGRENTAVESVDLAPGLNLAHWQSKIMSSHRVISRGGQQEVVGRLADTGGEPRVVIIGGSHSAFSAAWVLLEDIPGLTFGAGGVQIIHRSAPRVMYRTCDEARDDGYEFGEADVCQVTGRVHRHGGLRGEGRRAWRRMDGKAGEQPDGRVAFTLTAGLSRAELIHRLDAADLIVSALGYRMVTVPVFDADGLPVPLPNAGPCVDPCSRLCAADGRPVPGVLAVGLGSGFLPPKELGGEASFAGSHASVWENQHGLGEMIYRAVKDRAVQPILDPGAQWPSGGRLSASLAVLTAVYEQRFGRPPLEYDTTTPPL